MATTPRSLIVTGATGKQGGALISALLSKPSQPFEIYAVTRNKTSSRAQSLAKQPNVHLIQGDFSNPTAILSQVPSPWGLFSVTMPMNAKTEEQQGKAMTAAAVAAGIKHLVFTSVDREVEAGRVPHFRSKYNIEQDIETKAKEQQGGAGQFTYTFIRPVAFYENLTKDFFGKGFVSIWKLNGEGGRKLQMVSTKDIGKVAAEAFLRHDAEEFRNNGIPLVGDELTFGEAKKVFRATTGQDMPETYGFVGRMLKTMLHEQLGIMFNWFKSHGFRNDVGEVRKRFPFLKDFKAWLEEESAWRKQ